MKHKSPSKFVILSVLLALMFSAAGVSPSQAIGDYKVNLSWSANLLTNPGAETGNLSGWSGDTGSWSTATENPHQGSRSFITTHYWSTRYQEIDLLAAGFTAGDLDGAPTVTVGEWFKGFDCGGGCNPADRYYLKVELRNAAHTPIASWNVGTQASPVTATATWTEQTHTFSGYGNGLRYIYLEDGGDDVEGWGGYYGAMMDDAYVMLDSGDAIAPTVTGFTAPPVHNSLDIPITSFTATDNNAVTGYKITEEISPAPLAGDAGWTGSAPATYHVASNGSYTLYPWVKDIAGNVSALYGSPASVTVDTSVPFYVRSGGTGDCMSWANACELQTALTQAVSGNTIWVAAGTYKPTTTDADPRKATFQLKNGVDVYGGFPNTGNPIFSDRDPATHPSILSGDLAGNDNANVNITEATRSENSYHVVFSDTGTARLDGFTVTGGNANGPSASTNHFGGGIKATYGASFIFSNLIVRENSGQYGGGAYNAPSAVPLFINSTFYGNSANYGGGMYNSGSSPTVVNVTFHNNIASSAGGGMLSDSSVAKITNVTFSGNSSVQGGGMLNMVSSALQIRNSIFWQNSAPISSQLNGYATVDTSVVQGGYAGGTNIITTDPLLGTPDNYGGFTPTIPLLVGSSAIDTGNDTVCQAAVGAPDYGAGGLDQRGVTRPQGAHCDIGAFEAEAPGYTLTIVSAHGTVAKNPDKAEYNVGEVVQLTAAPDNGWDFVNWTGDLTGGDNPASITIQGNTTVTANYSLPVVSSTITETFNNATAPDWTLLGNAVLTENTVDSGGDPNGWLRVTDAVSDQVGAAVYNTPIPSSANFEVQFDYAAYGGNGADGIAFYLIDGESAPTLGNMGGSLGYAGVTNGYLGIGFSEYWVSEGVFIWGPGDLTSGFEPLTFSNFSPMATVDRTDANHVRITFFDKHISVWINGTPVISNFDVSSQIAPDTVKFGLSGATGGQANIHEIKNFGLSIQPPLLNVNPTSWDFGSHIVGTTSDAKTFIITNNGYSDLELGAFSASGDFALLNDSYCNGQTIPVGGTCTFDVAFFPLSGGIHTNSVSIPSNALSSVDTVSLSGRACISSAITVTSNANSGPGSLRQAIADVCSGGTITFANNYTITLDSELLIDKNMTIDGGTHAVTVSGNDVTRVFNISYGNVAFNHITIADGNVQIDDCGGFVGSGYLCGGGMFLQNDTVIVTISNSVLSGNDAPTGGGIANMGGALTLVDSVISGNTAIEQGGGVYNEGALTVTNTSFSANSAALGGGIRNIGDLTVSGSVFSNNHAVYNHDWGFGGYGGGIYSTQNPLIVTGSAFSNNIADAGGAGIINGFGNLTIVNSTFSGNSTAGNGAEDGGGTIFQFDGVLTLVNSTVSGNSSASPHEARSGIYVVDVESAPATLSLSNSIVANNNGGNNFQLDSGATFTSQGHNLSDNWNGLTTDSTDLTADPMLGLLGDYGGPTPTIPLLPGSPAIDAGNDATCSDPATVNNLDQRGVTRPQGSHCDIGAFESEAYTLVYTAGANGSITGASPQTVYRGASGSSVTAVPNAGYRFVSWSDGVLTASRTDVNVTRNITVTATFARNNQPPTNIALSAASVSENKPVGTVIGTLSTTDPDAGNTFTYSFCGGTNDASFSIAGASLKTAAVFDYETKNSYAICIRTTDNGGLFFDKNFTITVANVVETVSVTFRSTGAQDGWVLESGENTNVGKTMDASATTLRLGDDEAKKQYRSVLSFATGATLPDNAVITKITLKVKRQAIVGGGNPVATFQGFMVDIRKGIFGTSSLQTTDWNAAPSKTYGPFNTALVSGWYSIDLTAGKAYVNKLASLSGLTQIRLRFQLDDNNNAIANFLSLYSGNAPAASQPQLIIEYRIP